MFTVTGLVKAHRLSVRILHALSGSEWVSSGFLSPSKDMHIQLIGDSSLPLDMSVGVSDVWLMIV